jgi:hypothetical protein
MANGLSYTAAHWAKAERANTPVGKPPHLRRPLRWISSVPISWDDSYAARFGH